MQPHQERVEDEHAELDGRIGKLITFTAGETFRALDVAERDRLTRQRDLMLKYRDVLAERIAAFK